MSSINELRKDFLKSDKSEGVILNKLEINNVNIKTQLEINKHRIQQCKDENKNLTEELITQYQSGRNIFITGGAGTGKSTLIKLFPRAFPEDKIQLTSTTGITAINIGGQTIHRWSGIKLGKESVLIIYNRISRNSMMLKKWLNCKVLVIDEIGFLGKTTFELLDNLAKKIRNNDEPFGGIQLLLTGDFLQLPPVNDKYCFTSDSWRKLDFHVHTLTVPYRFNDVSYFDMLKRARIGKINDDDMIQLNKRVEAYSKFRKEKPNVNTIKPTRIYSTNKDVDKENMLELSKLQGKEYVFTATDKYYKKSKRRMLKSNKGNTQPLSDIDKTELQKVMIIDDDTGEEYTQIPAPINSNDYTEFLNDNLVSSNLKFKINAQVMLTVNLDVEMGLANGSRGIIKKIEPTFIEVLFVNGVVYKIELNNYKHKDDDYIIYRFQIPLILAWSSTFHKLQGKTLDYAIIDLGTSIFSPAMSYVGLSRVKNYDSLFLVNVFADKIYADDIAINFESNGYTYVNQTIKKVVNIDNDSNDSERSDSDSEQSEVVLFKSNKKRVVNNHGGAPIEYTESDSEVEIIFED